MRMTAKFCDFCAKDDGAARLAAGEYTADDGKEYHICAKHAKDVKRAGFKVSKFRNPGDMYL